jgi:2-C-methyl-D-erythritol 2,4-cyclodiphosphate synthase
MLAHSDGDVVIHALCDALLGAAALGDIGKHFPDTDASLAGVDSRELLTQVVAALAERGYQVVNADMTVALQMPRLAPHIDIMRERLASDLGVGQDQIGVKATTTEGMGFTGRGEGIAAWAVVLLE